MSSPSKVIWTEPSSSTTADWSSAVGRSFTFVTVTRTVTSSEGSSSSSTTTKPKLSSPKKSCSGVYS